MFALANTLCQLSGRWEGRILGKCLCFASYLGQTEPVPDAHGHAQQPSDQGVALFAFLDGGGRLLALIPHQKPS